MPRLIFDDVETSGSLTAEQARKLSAMYFIIPCDERPGVVTWACYDRSHRKIGGGISIDHAGTEAGS